MKTCPCSIPMGMYEKPFNLKKKKNVMLFLSFGVLHFSKRVCPANSKLFGFILLYLVTIPYSVPR